MLRDASPSLDQALDDRCSKLSGKSKSEPRVESQGVSSILVTYDDLNEPCTSL